jgi:hypothetical protein
MYPMWVSDHLNELREHGAVLLGQARIRRHRYRYTCKGQDIVIIIIINGAIESTFKKSLNVVSFINKKIKELHSIEITFE